jgi:hypothetical protein
VRATRWLLALALLCGGAQALASPLPRPPLADVRLADHTLVLSAPTTPADKVGTLLRSTLGQSTKYALGTWWEQYMTGVEPYRAAGDRAETSNTMDSEEVRRYTSEAYAVAVALATGAYDPAVTGVDTLTAARRVAKIVDFVTSTHRVNLAGKVGWGGSVQAGMWASEVAVAGWLIGPALSPTTQLFVGRMLAYEADVIAARQVHYLRDRSGRIRTPGNSGAEELAWDGVALWAAVELLPHHYRRPVWAEAAYRRFVGAYSRPADVHSGRVVNGYSLSAWLGGSNVEPTGFVVNHYRVNPDYTEDIALWGAPLSGLVGDGLPDALLEGADTTYRALTSYRFPSPPFRAPGGTVYQPGSTTLYYPSGADWGEHREAVFGSMDAQTAVLARTWQVRVTAGKWAAAHLDVVRRMQARYDTGQIHGPRSEDHYRAREEHDAFLLGNAYLTWWLAANKRLRVDTATADSKAAV